MWDLPRPGLEPVSPALASGFSTTAPGKPVRQCHRWEQLGAGENSRQRGEQEKDTRVERVDLFRCPVSIELGGTVREYGAGK